VSANDIGQVVQAGLSHGTVVNVNVLSESIDNRTLRTIWRAHMIGI